jgi:hypothetical protein
MGTLTGEQWLQLEIQRYPLLGVKIEVLPGVIFCDVIAQVILRTWCEATMRGIPFVPAETPPVLPAGCRHSLPTVQAALLLELADDQFLELGRKGIDLRDLSEVELSWLEGVKVKTVQNWRRNGSGPTYRKQGSGSRAPVVYPILSLRDWRKQHRATNTTQSIGRTQRSRHS